MEYDEVLKKLKSQANPKNVQGMARFGINPPLRKLAKEIGRG